MVLRRLHRRRRILLQRRRHGSRPALPRLTQYLRFTYMTVSELFVLSLTTVVDVGDGAGMGTLLAQISAAQNADVRASFRRRMELWAGLRRGRRRLERAGRGGTRGEVLGAAAPVRPPPSVFPCLHRPTKFLDLAPPRCKICQISSLSRFGDLRQRRFCPHSEANRAPTRRPQGLSPQACSCWQRAYRSL